MSRNYDEEIKDNIRHYAYNFDFDVIHEYMIKAFRPFMKVGNALELGCFQGAFTKRLGKIFNDITCVEASKEAIKEAQKSLMQYDNITFINEVFENLQLSEKFSNIFLTHVLEHIDDRVGLLNKINDELLETNGILFVACPNANAPSRQIAVKMGLIESNCFVTEAEKAHGHRITYSLKSLEKEINESRLNIIYKSGIFFKAMANFQWDQLLCTDIVSKEYLDGCYELGKDYPDLCSSIYFICVKG